MSDEKSRGGITIRVPDKAVVAIVLAIGGSAWNKVEGMINRTETTLVQQGVYELLGSRLEKTMVDVDRLKARVHELESAKDVKGSQAPAHPIPTSPSPFKAKISSSGGQGLRFQQSRLPKYDLIQRKVESGHFQKLMEDVELENGK